MLSFRTHFIALVAGMLLSLSSAMATITLAPLFQDHAILQRDQPIPIWGRATPGEKITASFRDQQVSATTDHDGRWIVYLEPLSAAIEPADLTITGETTLIVHDILIGEVWLATGQSNMTRPLSSLPDAETMLATVNNPFVRHINIALTTADTPADSVETSGWLPATPENAGKFSAVAWFFSAELQRKLGVPVGIIHSSWGGSSIEAWMDQRTLQSTSAWPAIKQRWDNLVQTLPTIQAEYDTWQKADEAAKVSGQKNSLPRPVIPLGPGTQRQPTALFNGMLSPLQPYAIRGNIWYQGEANWDRPTEYAELFPAMIQAWRAQWGLDDFPFYFVQLPNYTDARDSTGKGWASIREAQTAALQLPHTGMAVTIDCGDASDLHPQNKPTVGQRLARIAEAKTYGITGDWSGPVFSKAVPEGANMRVTFDHADSGLISDRHPPRSLEIAGADRNFHAATASIEGNTLVVHSPDVPAPVAVRYAWSSAPRANLFNGAGLPVAPFRSDDW